MSSAARAISASSRRPAGRGLILLLTPLLLLSSLELHSSPQEHSALDPPEMVFSAARHPAQPGHFEASGEALRPRCPACLLQLQTLCGSLPLPHAVSRPLGRQAASAQQAARLLSAPVAGTPSRAPPLA